MNKNAVLLLDVHAQLGEGAIWDNEKKLLYWVDINGCSVHVYDPVSGDDRRICTGEPVGCVVPRARGGLAIAGASGFYLLDPHSGTRFFLGNPAAGQAGVRFNDGKCDPAGRFWAGTISPARKPDCALYVMDSDHSIRRMLDGVTNSNGIVWSLDESVMYYIDTPTMRVDCFDYDRATATISGRRTVISVPGGMGKPDGMTIDEEGMLWIAMWGGGRVTRWDPSSGKLLAEYGVGSSRVTSCAFGGTGLETLYITTASAGMTEDELLREPHAGALYSLTTGIRGVPAVAFAG